MMLNKVDSISDIFPNHIGFVSSIDGHEEQVAQIDKKTKTRKSKSDQENRVFYCDFCPKSYLSYPALYTHRKNKHGECVYHDHKSNKGRPSTKKPDQAKAVDSRKDDYFFVEGRCRPKDNHCKDLGKLHDEIYKELYSKKPSKTFPIRCNLHKVELNEIGTTIKKNLIDSQMTSSKTCDEVFTLYIIHVSLLACEDILKTVIKLVLKYRELYNEKNKSSKSGEEYSTIETAEKIPEISNEFIKLMRTTNLIEPKQATEIVSNMCEWMYQNSYTNYTLRLN
jgi:hypothetical protein